MSGQIISGTVLDHRISRCGVVIEPGPDAAIRPFIETSSPLAGIVRLSVVKSSNSGTSTVSQSWSFAGGLLGASCVRVDVPARLDMRLEVLATDRTLLGTLEDSIEVRRTAG